ncbi:hypothetical protein [Streptomyces sp. WAC01280]|uniref:hypothetical protein n=1 Tax=Streptomyces sp. WAC01280 TaxID=2487424 RepID=UPI000F78506E|nr:hypothetical protein [Streptomyces sp. WAC01280]RSS51398.1 hypothetical protein EF909_34460 [Streptomyces sp. WAC01280]
MSTRNLLTLFSALLVGSLGVGLTGMYNNLTGLMHSGILGSISAATGLVCATLLHTNRLAQAEREAAFNSGYRLGLQHVTLGLLDTPPSGGAVIPLRPDLPRQHERQAQ